MGSDWGAGISSWSAHGMLDLDSGDWHRLCEHTKNPFMNLAVYELSMSKTITLRNNGTEA